MDRQSFDVSGHAHFLTFSCYHKQQFLTDDRVRHWLAESIYEARRIEDFALWAYVLMPDHVHLLIHPLREEYSIAAILRRIKEPVTHKLVRHWTEIAPKKLELMRANQGKRIVHRMWQAGGGYDRNLTNWESIGRAIDYIERNPVRREYVGEVTEWVWSSAIARAGEQNVPLTIDSTEGVLAAH